MDRFQEASRRSSLTTQASWLIAAKVASFVMNLAVPLIVVRLLDPYHFGLYRQAFLVVVTAQSLLPLSMGLSAYHFLPRLPDRAAETVSHILLFLAAVGGSAFVALALWPRLLEALFREAALVPYATLIGLTIALTIVSDFLETVTVAQQDIHLAVLFTVVGQFAKGALLIAAALVFSTLGALLTAVAVQTLFQTIILLWYVRLRFPGSVLAFDRRLFATQLSYALPFGLAGLVWRLEMDIHHYVVARRFGPAAYAIYAIGCLQVPLLGILRDAVNSVLMPRVSLLQHRVAEPEILRLVVAATRKLAAAHWPAYAYLIVMGPEFLTVLFTAQYRDSWPIFAVNLALVLLSVLAPTDAVLRAYSDQRKFLLRLRCLSLILLAVGLWWALPRYGMIGAVSVVVLITLLENVWIVRRVARLLHARASDWALLKDFPRLAAAAVAAALFAAAGRAALSPGSPLVSLALTAPLFAVTYAAFVWVLRIPTAEEKDTLRRLLLLIRNPWELVPRPVCLPSQRRDSPNEDQAANPD